MKARLSPLMTGTLGAIGLLGLTLSTSLAGSSMAPAAQPARSGEEIFNTHCMICHGAMGQGRLGPPLNQIPDEIKQLPPEALAQELTGLIRGGIPGAMPMFLPEQIGDAEVPALGQYLISLDDSLPPPSFYEAAAPITADQSPQGHTFYAETGHSIGGEFRDYWNRNGGLRAIGYPLSEEYNGIGEDGKIYRMQLFERARMELHTEAPAGRRILLTRIGANELDLRMHFLRLRGESGPPPTP